MLCRTSPFRTLVTLRRVKVRVRVEVRVRVRVRVTEVQKWTTPMLVMFVDGIRIV